MNYERYGQLAACSTVNEVAALLTAWNVKGSPGSSLYCPIARSLRTPGTEVITSETVIIEVMTGGIRCEHPVTRSLRDFVRSFDAGFWPDLSVHPVIATGDLLHPDLNGGYMDAGA